MEMYQVRYVLAAAEFLNFTRAAASCDVSQPALTKGIKALEAELSAPLFHREGRRIILSQLGRTLLPHLQQIATEAAAARTIAQSFTALDEIPVRLGVQSTIAPLPFGDLFSAFGNSHAEIDLTVSTGSAASLVAAVRADDLDLAIVARTPELETDFALVSLFPEGWVVVLPSSDPLVERETLTLDDLDGRSFIDRIDGDARGPFRAACDARSIRLETRYRAERDDWVLGMVRSGLGFALLPEHSAAATGVVHLPLQEPVLTRDVCLASVPGRPFAPSAAAFVRVVRGFSWTH